jgi:hypothetical protein
MQEFIRFCPPCIAIADISEYPPKPAIISLAGEGGLSKFLADFNFVAGDKFFGVYFLAGFELY